MSIELEDWSRVIGQLTAGEIDFDPFVHGQDEAFLEEIAKTNMSVFKKIPVEFLTEKLRDLGAHNLCVLWGEAECHAKNNYEETAINLIHKGISISSFHRDLLTEKIIRNALQCNVIDTLSHRSKLRPRQQSLYTLDLLRFSVSLTADAVRKLRLEDVCQIGDDALLEAFTKEPEYSYHLLQAGQPKLFVKMVESGAWMFPGVFDEHTRPTTTAEAIQKRMKLDVWMTKEIHYYNAFISSCPMEEIAPLMTSPARRKVLLQIFSAESLIETFKNDRDMKGRILEDQLGL